MVTPEKIEIRPDDKFPNLSRAPISEAIIEIRGKASVPWHEGTITSVLKTALPDYPTCESHRGVEQTVSINVGPGAKPAVNQLKDLGWRGLHFKSGDKLQRANLYRDSFSFHRLSPYESWDQFSAEGLRLWTIYASVAKQTEFQRIGLRFVNRVPVPEGAALEAILHNAPRHTEGLTLPLNVFFHRDTFQIPGHPYQLHVTSALQPKQATATGQVTSPTVIVDIDVATIRPIAPDIEALKAMLVEMRWLKNKTFFGYFTSNALSSFL